MTPIRRCPHMCAHLTTVAMGYTGAAALCIFAATALFSAPGAFARTNDLAVGIAVSVKPFEDVVPLTARVVQTTREAGVEDQQSGAGTIVTIRGQIGAVDKEKSSFSIAGRSVAVDGSTRAPAQMQSVSDLEGGQWIKVKIDTLESGEWHAERIEISGIEKRTKIEGTISRIWPDSMSIGGLTIRMPANVRVEDHALTPSERLFSELVTPRDPSQPVPWLVTDRLWSRGKIGVNQRIENDFSIGDSAADHYRESQPHVRLEFVGRGPAGTSAFLKMRSRNTFVLENAPLRRRPREAGIQLYEGYFLWRDVAGAPVALQVGRQDFDEYREWMFDAQLDAVRAYVYPLYPIVGEFAYINSLDNAADNKFRTVEDYLIHIHGRPVPSTELAVYRLWRTDRDARGREPIWTGVRWRGHYLGAKPWVDLAWLRGWDKGRRFEASAYDVGATLTKKLGSRRVSMTISSARGTGNDDNPKATGVDHQFRQTGYEDNTGIYNGVVSLQYYGEIFDPELANLDILTVGSGLSLSSAASLDVVYHRYRQTENATTVVRDLEATDLTLYDYGGRGIDPGNGRPVREMFFYPKVGWEIDVVLGLIRMFGIVDLKWVTGFFVPGDALSDPFWEQLPFKPRKRTAFLNQLNLEYRF